jgi:uncharacterized protein (DUF305 family)
MILTLFSVLAIQAQEVMRKHALNKSTNDPAWSDLQASMQRMHMSMAAIKASGDSDVDFVKLMVPHHQAAIDMARTQLLFGKDPQMRRLAQEIIIDQQSEIELMNLWLKQYDAHTSDAPQRKSGVRKED